MENIHLNQCLIIAAFMFSCGLLAMMLKQKFNRLLVESEGKLVGILSTSDVMRLVLSGQLELS